MRPLRPWAASRFCGIKITEKIFLGDPHRSNEEEDWKDDEVMVTQEAPFAPFRKVLYEMRFGRLILLCYELLRDWCLLLNINMPKSRNFTFLEDRLFVFLSYIIPIAIWMGRIAEITNSSKSRSLKTYYHQLFHRKIPSVDALWEIFCCWDICPPTFLRARLSEHGFACIPNNYSLQFLETVYW